MKIALLHYSAWPDIGGVENVVRDQANLLLNAGNEVQVISGTGVDTGDGYQLVVVPEMAPEFPLNKSVKAVLDRGQADQNFSQYRSLLVKTLDPILSGVDLTIIHNVLTMHHNLALTQALHDLAPRHKFIAWTHDLTATNTDFALPNPTKTPWNLVRMSVPGVIYVATSEKRATELKDNLKPPVTAEVIPNMVDPMRLFGLSPEMRASLLILEIPWRDFVFLLPARLLVRKNIDFAIEVIKQLRAGGRNPLLLITAAKMNEGPSAEHYGTFLKQSLPEDLKAHVIFINDYFVVQDDTMRDLYLLSDCLLYPSKQEGFGLPIIEAALHRMPVWCREVPAWEALQGTGSFLLDDIAKLGDAVKWLEGQSAFRQQRRCRRLFDPIIIYSKYYEGFFSRLAAAEKKS
jgi:glycosyltransferase involved in cell wall biosynthesis